MWASYLKVVNYSFKQMPGISVTRCKLVKIVSRRENSRKGNF